MQRPAVWFWVCLTGAILLSRLSHINILWADEDYHLAAAIQMLHGKMLYRDVWYDKPPLSAMVALLFGAWPGWPLRVAGTVLGKAHQRSGIRGERAVLGLAVSGADAPGAVGRLGVVARRVARGSF